MLPPRKEDAPGTVRRLTTGPFQGLIDSARGAALEEVRPTDGDRVFYAKPWWQKLLIMVGGPAPQADTFAPDELAVLRVFYNAPRGWDSRRWVRD